METACLVTGKSGPLLVEFVRQSTERQRQVLVTRSGRMDLGQDDDDHTSTFSWNRRSALSARSALLHACNIFGRVDEAIVVFSPTSDNSVFHETSIVGIEDRIDAEVKGYLYMLREVVAQMVKQGSGRVALVLQHPAEELLSPLECVGVASFVALADSLDRYYRNDAVSIQRFRTDQEDPEGFARFVLSRMDRASGLWDRIRRSSSWLRYPAGPHFLARRRVR